MGPQLTRLPRRPPAPAPPQQRPRRRQAGGGQPLAGAGPGPSPPLPARPCPRRTQKEAEGAELSTDCGTLYGAGTELWRGAPRRRRGETLKTTERKKTLAPRPRAPGAEPGSHPNSGVPVRPRPPRRTRTHGGTRTRGGTATSAGITTGTDLVG